MDKNGVIMKRITDYVTKEAELDFAIKPFLRYKTEFEVRQNSDENFALFCFVPELD